MDTLSGFETKRNDLLHAHTFEQLNEADENQLFRFRNKLSQLQTCSHCASVFMLENCLGRCQCSNGMDHIDYTKDNYVEAAKFTMPVWVFAFFKLYRAPFAQNIPEDLFIAKNRKNRSTSTDAREFLNSFNQQITYNSSTTPV